jgi:hypothetical protein
MHFTARQRGLEARPPCKRDYYLDGVALNLHGIYSGCERIFTQIAQIIDDNLPHGED